MIRIRSSQDGFRRGGIAHPVKETCYPEDFFSDAVLDAIKNEPKLVVETGLEPTGPEYLSESELHALCEQGGILVVGTEPRQQLITALKKKAAELDQAGIEIRDGGPVFLESDIDTLTSIEPVDPEQDSSTDGSIDPIVPEPDTETDESKGDEEMTLIDAARQAIAEDKVISSGAPDIKAMEEILGKNITAAERNEAWETIQAEQGA